MDMLLETNYIDTHEQNSDTLFNNHTVNYTEIDGRHSTGHDERCYITIYIQSKTLQIEVNSEARYSNIPEETFYSHVTVKKALLIFRSYSGHTIPLLSLAYVIVG